MTGDLIFLVAICVGLLLGILGAWRVAKDLAVRLKHSRLKYALTAWLVALILPIIVVQISALSGCALSVRDGLLCGGWMDADTFTCSRADYCRNLRFWAVLGSGPVVIVFGPMLMFVFRLAWDSMRKRENASSIEPTAAREARSGSSPSA